VCAKVVRGLHALTFARGSDHTNYPPTHAVDLTFEKRWRDLLKRMETRFSGPVDLNGLIFLIGVQELGQHAREFKKDEKLALMHIAICVLLVPFGYYKELGRDADGWPHFERVKDLPALGAKEQERLMKEAILAYFEEPRGGE
jgi:hypothetical protein